MTSTTEKKKWTIMLYLAGDNDLSDEMVWALTELFRIKMPDQIAVTVQFDPLAEGSCTRVFQPRAPVDIDGVFRLEGKSLKSESNAASLEVLANFIKGSVEKHGAENYALILCGHGSGIMGDFLTDYAPGRKDQSKGSLKISDLGKALNKVNKLCPKESREKGGKLIDVLGMDSCVMSMAEVAYEIKDHVKYLVGSEGFVQATGWPYYRLFKYLTKHIYDGKLHLDSQALANALVQRCANYYADYPDANISFDMAACDLAEIGAVQQAIKEFATFVAKSKDYKSLMNLIVLAHWKAQSYKWELYTDIGDFFGELQKACESFTSATKSEGNAIESLAQHCKNVTDAVNDAVMCSRFIGPEFQYSNGLSIYFPWSEYYYKADYKETAFAEKTGWHDFLTMYFRETQRIVRTDHPPKTPSGWQRYKLPSVTQKPRPSAPPALNEIRISPPQGKISDMVGEAVSRMKNMANKSEDYLVLPEEELSELKEWIARMEGGGGKAAGGHA